MVTYILQEITKTIIYGTLIIIFLSKFFFLISISGINTYICSYFARCFVFEVGWKKNHNCNFFSQFVLLLQEDQCKNYTMKCECYERSTNSIIRCYHLVMLARFVNANLEFLCSIDLNHAKCCVLQNHLI